MLLIGYVPFEARHAVLFLMSLVLVVYAISKRLKVKDLGFRTDNLKTALAKNLLSSLVLVSSMYAF